MTTENKAQRRAKREIYGALEAVQEKLGLDGRISKRGVPYLVGTLPGGRQYSVCYFRRHKGYTVFFPYGEWGSEQARRHVDSCEGVESVVEELSDEVVSTDA